MDSPRQPSIASLIFADYASMLCFVFPVVLWGMFAAADLGLWRSEPDEAEIKSRFFLRFALGASAICLPLLYWRIQGIRALLRDGVAIPAKLIGVWFMKDRGRIDYEYVYEGQTYRGGMALVKSKHAAALEVGQEITVLVHPANPSQSVVPAVFD